MLFVQISSMIRKRLLPILLLLCLMAFGYLDVSLLATFMAEPVNAQIPETGWYMSGANPARTSWVPEEVTGSLRVEWYRPIEAYIPQNVQIITANGLLYIASARGLYALDAANGEIAWRFDTELPLGNSPTVVDGIVYVGGYDRKLHALDAVTGVPLWEFVQARAGFSTNPLVVNGKVYMGNRDGYMYAIGAHGTPQQGQLIWKYKTGGPVLLSAAYKDGVVFFAANDNYAYALNATNGSLVWKSTKLPGDGFHSYWPVVYQDKVIFSAATTSGYRVALNPGTLSAKDGDGNQYMNFGQMQKDDLFFDGASDGVIGSAVWLDESWSQGKTVINGSRLCEYLENNPNPHPHLHKPWRRSLIVLNTQDGREYTFDSDQDGYAEYAPFAWWGTGSGNRYPPLVGSDGILYSNNIYSVNLAGIPYGKITGRIMGWKIGTPYLIVENGSGEPAEPQAISSGGNVIYRSICCDRVGDWFTITEPETSRYLWDYSHPLTAQTPNYDTMWHLIDDLGMARLTGNYGTKNGVYHSHGDQNPIVPYQGKLYTHRSNAIIAYGPGQGPGQLPRLTIREVRDEVLPVTSSDLKQRLEEEIQKIVDAGHLRPGYYNSGLFSGVDHFGNYFDNPGDTLYTLARAYPYLSPQLQQSTKNYLKSEYRTYFDPAMIARVGWADGAARETFPLPPEIEAALPQFPPSSWDHFRWSWERYPQHNFYAMWKYVQIFPEDAQQAYNLAKSRLEIPPNADYTYLAEWPMEHNAYIAGYLGFLKLQELAGKTGEDSELRTVVTNELNWLLESRAHEFTKDTFWDVDSYGPGYNFRVLNASRNFIMLVPELADYLREHALTKVQEALDEYDYTVPYWFVARYEATAIEGVMQNLYDYNALFQAKAYILKESCEELTKYLDAPAFERGDLFYIQNLIAAIEADSYPLADRVVLILYVDAPSP